MRWWTKAWFNDSEVGEAAMEISAEEAFGFIADRISKDTMLEQYYPQQMEAYHNAIEQTREQLLKQYSI